MVPDAVPKVQIDQGCYESDLQSWILFRRQLSQGGLQTLWGRTLDVQTGETFHGGLYVTQALYAEIQTLGESRHCLASSGP